MPESNVKLPMIPLRGIIAFPTTAVTFDVGRDKSVNAIERAMEGDRRVFSVAQRDAAKDQPHMADVYQVGTIILLKQLMRLPDGTVRVFADGVCRALLTDVIEGGEVQLADVFPINEAERVEGLQLTAFTRVIKTRAGKVARMRGSGQAELASAIAGERDPAALCDLVAANLITEVADKQAVLECMDIQLQLDTVLKLVTRELEYAKIESKIAAKVRENIDKANHDYYLREQISAIQEELGDAEDPDIAALRERLVQSKIEGEARERTEREMKKLARMTMHSPESSVSVNYIEYMLSLPWGKRTEKKVDIKKARAVLEGDHYGMHDVKDRLLEYLGVRALNPDVKSPIICLVGPPGVGKTSIARSVARALGRSFAQMSLGGVHDEAELRGHRRTYIGAMPGRVVSAIEHCGTMDPVMLLDEIDKLTNSMHGDPSSALLEILDPEQNVRFRDHYVDAPFDLSDVMFITTANTLDTIDRALIDRMEVIEVSSYTLEDKVQIAKRHLVPKQIKAHGLKAAKVKFQEATLRELIDKYTRESGVRTLERLIAKICRKAALRLSEDASVKSVTINSRVLVEFLGAPKYLRTSISALSTVGVVNGLAWTSVGGEVMPVEVVSLEGGGAVELTGKLGDVMKESAKLAHTTVRTQLSHCGLPIDYFKTHDMHVHVPEGAVPKDGPSAGVAITCAMLSAVTGIPARGDIAMTGEITLTGRVLPIGGVKEKLLAAYRMGVSNILLPRENEKDLEQIDQIVRNDMNVQLIDRVEDAFAQVLTEPVGRKAERMRAV